MAPALRLQAEFLTGRSGVSNTYGNERLCGEALNFDQMDGDFEVDDMEVWGFEAGDF